jgi:hypothetical protein
MASRRQQREGADPFGHDEATLEQVDHQLFGGLDRLLEIKLIRLDGGCQPRAKLDRTTIREYAEAMEQGAAFPAVVVFYDGQEYWLADGFHRYKAAKRLKLEVLRADVKQGTRRDAVLYSAGVNASHGLRRSNDDKRRAVMTLLDDEEWQGWSDQKIARWCKVSQPFVSKLRSSLKTVISDERIYTTKHGTTATMDVSGIREANQARAAEPPTPQVEVVGQEEGQPEPDGGHIVWAVPGAQNLRNTLSAADEPTASEQSAQPKGVYDRAERDQTRQLILRDLKWIIENLRAIGEERRAGALELLARSWARDWGMK